MNAVGTAPSPGPALRVTTASGTDVSVPMMSFGAASASGASGASESRANGAHPQFGTLPVPAGGGASGTVSPGGTKSGSATAAVAAGGGMPLIADDPSVLQTPSHAVLYHLCTSSIRNNMIAVGASTRYRQKYLTTVYYKPAVPAQREEGLAL
ncbi:hypothetical protein C8R44DRAFT_772758 [Mycena epipterygia]|nr:hypothetical protein C8R44DRAFT_772758 [Mycena epipterygia]